MLRRILCVVFLSTASALAADPVTRPVEMRQPTTAPSRIVAATVYQGTALVTREVNVPEGVGLMELVVTPLPEQTADSSLYTEGSDGLRVLSTRFRTSAVQEDTRVEVRQKQDQIKTLQQQAELISKQMAVAEQNEQLLGKLENFTSATLQTMTDKGWFNGDATIARSPGSSWPRAMRHRAAEVKSRQAAAANAEQVDFVQRQLAELTAGARCTERDAVITVDKTAPAASTVRLNYLVNAANWQPGYKIHTGVDADNKVHVEYLASVQQQSGEDWGDADISLSTAEPMLNAAPPDLLAGVDDWGGAGDGGRAAATLVVSEAAAVISRPREQSAKDMARGADINPSFDRVQNQIAAKAAPPAGSAKAPTAPTTNPPAWP